MFVEFALIFLIYFGLLLGTFDFGQFLFIHQAMVERARWAARWAMISGNATNAQIQNMVIYGQTTAGSNAYFGLTSSMVTVAQSNPNTGNWIISVQIANYPYQILSPYISGTYNGPHINVIVPLGLYD
jgi:Flp pilus assembly protein TadG